MAFECLEKYTEHSIKYDTEPDYKHTSFMANRVEYHRKDSAKDHIDNETAIRLKDLKNNLFDSIRLDERVKKIEARLKEVAK